VEYGGPVAALDCSREQHEQQREQQRQNHKGRESAAARAADTVGQDGHWDFVIDSSFEPVCRQAGFVIRHSPCPARTA